MPAKKSPESAVVAFFETAPISDAVLVLNIVKDIVSRRSGTPKPKRTTRVPAEPLNVKGV